MRTSKISNKIMGMVVAITCVCSMAISASAAYYGSTTYTFYDEHSWSNDSAVIRRDVFSGNRLIGTSVHEYVDNLFTDEVRGGYSPVGGSGFCSLTTNGHSTNVTDDTEAGEMIYTNYIDYVGGKSTRVNCVRN